MDESSAEKECFTILGELLKPEDGGRLDIKVFLAAQLYTCSSARRYLERILKSQAAIFEIHHQDNNRADIEAFTKSFINDDLIHSLDLTKDKVEEYFKLVVSSSRSIFMWVKLAKQLFEDVIGGKPVPLSKAAVEDFFKELPPDLDAAYDRLVNRLEDRLRDQRQLNRAREVFRIATTTKRSLRITEYSDLIAWSSAEKDLDGRALSEFRPPNLESVIMGSTWNLLVVTHRFQQQTGDVNIPGLTPSVEIIHPSARSFLQRRFKLLDSESSKSSSDSTFVRDACVAFLKRLAVQVRVSRDKGSLCKGMNEYPFVVYALQHLVDHVSDQDLVACRVMREVFEDIAAASLLFPLLREWMEKAAARLHVETELPQEALAGTKMTLEEKSALLDYAVRFGYQVAAEIIIISGADVNYQCGDWGHESVVPRAISSDKIDDEETSAVVNVLLMHGADVNSTTKFQGTPLHYAGLKRKKGVIQLLLAYNPKRNVRDFKEMTPLLRAIIGRKGPDKEKDLLTESAEQCILLLAESGGSLQAPDHAGYKPIHWVAGKGGVRILEFLLDKGIPVDDFAMDSGSTPLAHRIQHPRVVEYLLGKGADPTLQDNWGRSSLHWAAITGSHESLDLLLGRLSTMGDVDRAAVLNAKDTAMRTALIAASEGGYLECVKRLVKQKETNINEVKGYLEWVHEGTALSWAVRGGHLEVAKYLMEREGISLEGSTAPWRKMSLLSHAAATGNIEMLRLVIKYKKRREFVNLGKPDAGGQSPFMHAAKNGHLEMLQKWPWLWRIDVDIADQSGNTALMLAAMWGHLDTVKWLIEKRSAEFKTKANKSGDTALKLAEFHGHQEVVNFLRQQGADTTEREGGYAAETRQD